MPVGIGACLAWSLAVASAVHGGVPASNPSTGPVKPDGTSAHLCGVYCLYTAARSLGKSPDFIDLLKPEYIGSGGGSSMKELERAAKSLSLHPLASMGLSTSDLRHSPYPLILHVKSNYGQVRYDHFILFLGTRNGQALIFDPRSPALKLLTFDDIARIWSGDCLAVSLTDVSRWSLRRQSLLAFAAWTAVAVAGIAAARLLARRVASVRFTGRNWWAYVTASLLLASAGVALGVVHHATTDGGFLVVEDATRDVEERHTAAFLPEIQLAELRRLIADGRVTLIDARPASQYRAGHIDGAINLTVEEARSGRERLLPWLDRQSVVVVYCGGPHCDYARVVGVILRLAKFPNIRLYNEGWKELQATEQRR